MGEGLNFDSESRIKFDLEVATTQCMTNLTDVSLQIEGRKFVLLKTFTDYKINKNSAGIIVSIEASEPRIVKEETLLLDYGYCGAATSTRMSAPNLPNFYQK